MTDAKAVKSVVEKFREKYGAKDVKKYYSKFDVAVLPLASGSKEREVKWWICLSAFRFSLSTDGEPVVSSRPYQNLLRQDWIQKSVSSNLASG